MRIKDGKPFIRPCRSIPSDGNENNEWIASIGALYEPLTTLMPLAGAAMLLPDRPGGEPRIAARLRAEAPWMSELSGCGNAVLSFAGVNSNAELAGNPRCSGTSSPVFPRA